MAKFLKAGKNGLQVFGRFPEKSGDELVSSLTNILCSIIRDVQCRYNALHVVVIAMPGMG